MRRLMNDNRIREISSSVDIRGFELLLVLYQRMTNIHMMKWSDFGLIRETYGNRLLLDLNHFIRKFYMGIYIDKHRLISKYPILSVKLYRCATYYDKY